MKKFNLPDWTQTELTDKIEFQFCAMPRELVYGDTFEELGVYGTFIYTLMLDRMRLSAKNSEKFTDKNGRLYIIFTIEEVMRVCKCAKHTAVKYMKQLEDIGLIEKKLQGGGKPALIYVKDFAYYASDKDLSTDENAMELYRNGWILKHASSNKNNISEKGETDSDDDASDDDAIYLPAVIAKAFSTVVRKLRNADKGESGDGAD